MTEQKPASDPTVVDFGEDEQKLHWLKMIDYHDEEIEALMKKVKEHQQQRAEAEEEFYDGVPQRWDSIKVGGKTVFQREVKTGAERVYIEDLKKKYPRIYEELKRAKESEKTRRI